MGHALFSTFPRSMRWQAVVADMADGADAADVAALSAHAAETALGRAAGNPVYRTAVELLVRIPVAGREASLATGLAAIGLDVRREPDLTGLVFAAGEHLDRAIEDSAAASDFGELARRALLSALSSRIGRELPGLLDAAPADVRLALRRLSRPEEFSGLARAFYTRLLSETLSYFLDRALADHVGEGRRFHDLGERSRFTDDIHAYCLEATRIVHEYSIGWYAKHVYQSDDLTARSVAGYGAFALRKIVGELRRRKTGP